VQSRRHSTRRPSSEKGRGTRSTYPPSWLQTSLPASESVAGPPRGDVAPPPGPIPTAKRALPAAPTESNTWAQFPTRPQTAPLGELGIGPIVATVPSQLGGVQAVRELLGRYLEGQRDVEYGTRWYQHQAKIGIDGSIVAWLPRVGKSRPYEVHVEVTQSACDRLGLELSIELLRELRQLGGRASRIDAHFDDRHGISSPALVDAAVDARQMHSRVRRTSCHAWKEAGVVETVYVGSRQSGRMLRVYNGDKMHGPGTGVRWELEHHAEHAERFAEIIAGSPPSEMGELLMESIRSHVDFVDRSAVGIHAERAELLPWWAELVGSAKRLVLRWPSPVEYVQRKAAWLERQVAPALALVCGWKGGAQRGEFNQRMQHYLRHLLSEGQSRLTVAQYDLLDDRSRTNLAAARWALS
jgi:Replication initiation factor